MNQQSNPLRGAETLAPNFARSAVTEPLTRLLRLTEAALMAKAAQCLGSNSLDPLAPDAPEGVARQLEDRAAQCNAWLLTIERNAGRISPAREDEMRANCAEWLRMAK
jgi:hypothetical protein